MDVFEKWRTTTRSPMKAVFARSEGRLQPHYVRAIKALPEIGFLLEKRWYRHHVNLTGIDPIELQREIMPKIRWLDVLGFDYIHANCIQFSNLLYKAILAMKNVTWEPRNYLSAQSSRLNPSLLDAMIENGYEEAARSFLQQEEDAKSVKQQP